MRAQIIAGGGLAGAAAACALAQAGRTVRVLERSTGPTDKVCGDFLSSEAQHYLAQLGLDVAGLGGHPITRVRLVRGARVREARLPFRGLGLSRRILDEALLRHAAAAGAEVARGVSVDRLSPEIDFLATGKHDLRIGGRKPATTPEDLVGFKTYLELGSTQRDALADAVEVILFADGYAGLQQVGNGRANLCLLIHRDHLRHAGGTWTALLEDLRRGSPHLHGRLTGARMLLARPLAIARVPYGFIHRPDAAESVFRLGDQACVIPSFAGDGMAMALHSAALAVRCHLRGMPAAAYHRQLSRDVAGPIRRAGALYRIGQWRIGRWAPGQALLIHALRLSPGLLTHAAAATRIAEAAWLHGGATPAHPTVAVP
ncbi:MAG: NAD(P)-binding protein [Rhodospirillales bacterium]|nr:NAD(P)-binding protein [Rhodospirillales bacterium]